MTASKDFSLFDFELENHAPAYQRGKLPKCDFPGSCPSSRFASSAAPAGAVAAIPCACKPVHRLQKRLLSLGGHAQRPCDSGRGGKTIGETTIAAYNDSYAQRDPFRGCLFQYSRKECPVGVFTDEELLPHEGLLRTDLYRDLQATS
jgi:hypothetical protein